MFVEGKFGEALVIFQFIEVNIRIGIISLKSLIILFGFIFLTFNSHEHILYGPLNSVSDFHGISMGHKI